MCCTGLRVDVYVLYSQLYLSRYPCKADIFARWTLVSGFGLCDITFCKEDLQGRQQELVSRVSGPVITRFY